MDSIQDETVEIVKSIVGDNKFSVALIHYKGWVGECDLCGCEVFNWTSKKVVNTYPKSINDKLKR